MDNAVLMIAFHFPPAAMSSGHLRTLGFARYLPTFGWQPVVLSARALAYPQIGPVAAGVIPSDCVVRRTLAFDVSRHFSIGGKYPGFLAQPDRWSSWWVTAVCQGMSLIRRYRVRAIWSTYPIMTAHCVAHSLSRLAKVPWIADFRDPVARSVEASNPYSVASQRRWECRVFERADRVVLTTPGALRQYAAAYPKAAAGGKLRVIENGYDEAAFVDLPKPESAGCRAPLVFLHSGVLYPDGRDPGPFFLALANLRVAGKLGPGDVRVVLRASGMDASYSREVQRLGLDDMVTLAPPVSNREALIEQAAADALLLFQGSRFDQQIPAKAYEYLRIGRPIFALVGDQGDTAGLLRETEGAELVPIDDANIIAARLVDFVRAIRNGVARRAKVDEIARCSRRERTVQLANLLGEIAA